MYVLCITVMINSLLILINKVSIDVRNYNVLGEIGDINFIKGIYVIGLKFFELFLLNGKIYIYC